MLFVVFSFGKHILSDYEKFSNSPLLMQMTLFVQLNLGLMHPCTTL